MHALRTDNMRDFVKSRILKEYKIQMKVYKDYTDWPLEVQSSLIQF